MEEEHLKRVLCYDKDIMIDSCHIMIDSCHITAACGTDMVKVDIWWVDWHWFIVLLTPDLLCFVFLIIHSLRIYWGVLLAKSSKQLCRKSSVEPLRRNCSTRFHNSLGFPWHRDHRTEVYLENDHWLEVGSMLPLSCTYKMFVWSDFSQQRLRLYLCKNKQWRYWWILCSMISLKWVSVSAGLTVCFMN